MSLEELKQINFEKGWFVEENMINFTIIFIYIYFIYM
jgi:hypothetical protein